MHSKRDNDSIARDTEMVKDLVSTEDRECELWRYEPDICRYCTLFHVPSLDNGVALVYNLSSHMKPYGDSAEDHDKHMKSGLQV